MYVKVVDVRGETDCLNEKGSLFLGRSVPVLRTDPIGSN